jgi:hypothetical protein
MISRPNATASRSICDGKSPVDLSASTELGVENKSLSAGSVIRESCAPFGRDPF